jgi:hypothetical protein
MNSYGSAHTSDKRLSVSVCQDFFIGPHKKNNRINKRKKAEKHH